MFIAQNFNYNDRADNQDDHKPENAKRAMDKDGYYRRWNDGGKQSYYSRQDRYSNN